MASVSGVIPETSKGDSGFSEIGGDKMASTATAIPDQPDRKIVAPLWHTFIVLFVLLGLSFLSARSHSVSGMGHSRSRVANYLTVMVVEWCVVAFIWVGIRLRGVEMRDLIGGAWPNWVAVARDLGVTIVFLIVANLVLGLIGFLLRISPNQAIRGIFPQGPAEIAFYLFLALTAGICEEIIFRGYLQKQFAGITGSAVAGLLIQGIVFGAAHGYQGPKLMVVIAVYGCLFGLLAQWRRSLRPGMIGHFLHDGITGIVGRHLIR
jgi:uncharacterized protein